MRPIRANRQHLIDALGLIRLDVSIWNEILEDTSPFKARSVCVGQS